MDCGIDQAGIVAAGFIDASVATPTKVNLESEGWWTALLNESPPQLYVATKTRGEYMGGTPTEEDGFGKESTQITGATHELTLEFEGIDDNRLFTEGVNSKKWKFVGITNGGKGFFVDAPVTVYGKLQIPRGITTGAFWAMTAKWQDFANPIVFDAPDNIFDE
jgi:hypothetical protein